MSYCRWLESDIYMFLASKLNKEGYEIICCWCHLRKDNRDSVFHKRSDAIQHILFHRENGDFVPEYVIETLKQEIEKDGDEL
jgi:hypothetical protein